MQIKCEVGSAAMTMMIPAVSWRYLRIEFAGIAAAPNSELNGLTLGSVGRRTVLEYVQVSYANDDAFEWFGGSVNGRYLISIGCLDDDFDTDNGWSGHVQFGVGQRLRQRADQSISQAFESDNDASGSFNKPYTTGVFSNMTLIGPLQDTSWTLGQALRRIRSTLALVQQRRFAVIRA